MDEHSIREIAAKAGGVIALSKKLGLSRAAVSQWKRVPAEQVLKVEALTGVSRYDMRPDVFGPAPQCQCATEQEAA
jgi:DNA-binding transcriptional regulator YdaS (Cro superfamily)